MLIKTLYNLFCGSESQDGRSDSVSPDVIDKHTNKFIFPCPHCPCLLFFEYLRGVYTQTVSYVREKRF